MNSLRSPVSSFGAASPFADYAPPNTRRPTWGLQTAQGRTAFRGLRTRREAERLRPLWDAAFPDHAPYAVTREPAP